MSVETLKPALALAVLLSLLAGCASASQNARPAQSRDRMAALYLPRYPTEIPIVGGRPLHPETGKPVNCTLMAPFEGRLKDYRNLGVFYPWAYETTAEVGGWTAFLSMGLLLGLHEWQIREGVAMSRACRALTAPPAAAPKVTPPESPDWCRGERQEWLGVACLTRGK